MIVDADDKLSDLSARDRWFRSNSQRMITNADDKMLDLSTKRMGTRDIQVYRQGRTGNDTTGQLKKDAPGIRMIPGDNRSTLGIESEGYGQN